MNKNEMMHAIDGILFILGEDGIKIEKLTEVLKISKKETIQIINEMSEIQKSDQTRASYVNLINDQINLKLKNDYNEMYYNLKIGRPPKLTDINLEVLTIIAYEQPVTKTKVNSIRGLNSDNSFKKLLNLKLIAKSGVSSDRFNSSLYKTTKKFLDYMQIDSLEDLPNKEEIKEEVLQSLEQI